jgi:hypothetical protein
MFVAKSTAIYGGHAVTLLVVFDGTHWSKLTAAYYDHPDMRALFEALSSDNDGEVAEAEEKLRPSIMVDGEVFELCLADCRIP